MSRLVISKAERRAMGDALRDILADGGQFRDVRRGMGLSIVQMPRDVYLPRGQAKAASRRVRP